MESVERHGVWYLMAAPFAGLAYVIVLPFIAIGTITVLAGKKLLGGAINLLTSLASFGWRPMEAYLAGRRNRRAK